MRALAGLVGQLARADSPVLIEGETGVGKELVAEAIRAASSRATGPWVVFDCGATTASLVGAELFGVERGAYTGAESSRPGAFEDADGGTLFLDEIGELPLDEQPLLLRAIERGTTRRVGGRAEVRSDVRVVAATNRNLAEEVRAGRFRQDLFFRIAALRLRVPPLRDRPEDIGPLVDELAAEAGVVVSPEVLVLFRSYDWPGNVRELRNAVHRLAVDPSFKPRAQGQAAPSPHDQDGQVLPLPDARRRAIAEFEASYLRHVLDRASGTIARAAELAGVSRRVLTLLVARHGLRVRDRE
jgi:DNA-binding NtrC family response regulator